MTKIEPLLFIGHGSPMNIINRNAYTKAIQNLGQKLDKPRAVLIISAHWLTRGSFLTYRDDKLDTIYDFGGFPKELYQVSYNPRGSKIIAQEIKYILEPNLVNFDSERGLDHGSWGVLMHLFPEADIPVVQLSVDFSKSIEQDFEFAKSLSKLRESGVLIVVSGNIIHSFDELDFDENAKPKTWAVDFQIDFKEKLANRKYQDLLAHLSQLD